MRVLLITVGSRGDAGHDVDLWLQTDMHPLAPTSGKITIHELPFTCMNFYKFAGNPNPAHDHPNPRVKFTGVICDVCGELVVPCTMQVLDSYLTDKPNVIVASSLARHLGMALSTKLDIPLCLVQLQPLVPTRCFPHYSITDDRVRAMVRQSMIMNILTWNWRYFSTSL